MKRKVNTLGFKKAPSTLISFRYSTIALAITLILMLIIPKVLNYAPGTINTPFDIQMSYISYNTQFFALATLIILGIVISHKISLHEVDTWYSDTDKSKFTDIKRLQKIRNKCITLPYIYFAVEIILPSTIAFILLSITGSHSAIMIGKVILLLGSFSLLLAVVSFIFSKDIYDELLSKTYIEGFNIGARIGLKQRIFLLIFPILLASILMTALIGYSSSIREKEESLFYIYSNQIKNVFDTSKTYTIKEIYSILSSINTLSDTDKFFMITENANAICVKGTPVSNFVIEFTLQLSDENNGTDAQGCSLKLKTPTGETVYAGILYDVVAQNTFRYLMIVSVFLISISLVILYIFANSIRNSIQKITVGFEHIIDYTDTNSLLPIVTNDEIGDLTKAFNEIQKLNTKLLANIKDNQTMLIEKERLASLGQMIGGIAHNLKTPIFSISGGLEGLNDLIQEFDSSIEDSTVTDQDMHDIAKDMNEWIEKLKAHISYMSDVITAVKGQAVTLSESEEIEFNIEELFKRIDILMKHEVKNALINLNLENTVDNNTFIKGNINSLVQVINNIISNAIEAYNGKPEQNVDVFAKVEDNTIIITIQDYGPGIPKAVKEKLFSEMITTKGKNGTGLGLFMSYSTIKANFQGDIKVESEENQGTKFTIILPY